MIASYYRSGI